MDHSWEESGPAAPVSRLDARLPGRQKVLGFCYDGHAICLPAERIDQVPNGGIVIPGTELTLTVRQRDGMAAVAGPNGAEVAAIGAYWFAWHTAFPSTEVVSNIVD